MWFAYFMYFPIMDWFLSAEEIGKVDALLRRLKRFGYIQNKAVASFILGDAKFAELSNNGFE